MRTDVLNARIKEMRMERGLTLKETADHLGIKEATMQRYESGVIKNIKHQYVCDMAKLFGCSPNYLFGFTNEKHGDMFVPQLLKSESEAHGKVACGTDDDKYKYTMLPCPEDVHIDFYIKCPDDSMSGIGMKKGTFIYVNRTDTAENGDIVIVSLSGVLTPRRYYSDESKILLQAENSAYAPSVFLKDESSDFCILGKAIGYFSKLDQVIGN